MWMSCSGHVWAGYVPAMQPGVRIEPTPGGPDPRSSSDRSAVAAPDESALGALTALQAHGTDAAGNVEVTLDGRGRMVDLVLSELVVSGGRRSVERGVREAFDAAADELDRLRQEQAAGMLEAGQLQIAALTGQLKELSDHADTRMREALQQFRDQTDRIGGSS